MEPFGNENYGNDVMTAPGDPFVISCTLDASRDLVWKAWTERKRLMQWFGPKGFTMPAAKMNLRPDGNFHFCLCSPTGEEMWGKWTFREITAPGRIVLVHSFSDEDGGIARHPFSPNWPLEMLSTTTFEEACGKTKVTLQWLPLQPTEAELKTFEESFEGMVQGWNGTFEQLVEYLATA
jgi:uncharacterized protein YndB with AHSA1/START domain